MLDPSVDVETMLCGAAASPCLLLSAESVVFLPI